MLNFDLAKFTNDLFFKKSYPFRTLHICTVFPHIVAAATILFSIHPVRKLFKERKLFKGGNYMRKYGKSRGGVSLVE